MPIELYVDHNSSGVRFNAIFVVPILLDFKMTSLTVNFPKFRISLIVWSETLYVPGSVLMMELGEYRSESNADAIVNSFIVEPGSKTSVTERFRYVRL